MMKARFLLLSAVLFTVTSSLDAQIFPTVEPTKDKPQPARQQQGGAEAPLQSVRGIWQAKLQGGEYAVSTDRITSVSRHSYVLDGTLLVDEVTIDTTGQALARFYFLSPLAANNSAGNTAAAAIEKGKGMLDAAGQQTGVQLENMVIKKYPDTTHAKSIEYRLGSQAELINLFNSAKQAWQSGQGGNYNGQVK